MIGIESSGRVENFSLGILDSDQKYLLLITPDYSTSSTLLQKMLSIKVQLWGVTLVGRLMIVKKFFDII